jgi:hypothetical protein
MTGNPAHRLAKPALPPCHVGTLQQPYLPAFAMQNAVQAARPPFGFVVAIVVSILFWALVSAIVLWLNRRHAQLRRASGPNHRTLNVFCPEFFFWLGICQLIAGAVPCIGLFILYCLKKDSEAYIADAGREHFAYIANFGIYSSLSGEVS